jgi:hypothetical protein
MPRNFSRHAAELDRMSLAPSYLCPASKATPHFGFDLREKAPRSPARWPSSGILDRDAYLAVALFRSAKSVRQE